MRKLFLFFSIFLLISDFQGYARKRTLSEMFQAFSTVPNTKRRGVKSFLNQAPNVLHEEKELTILGNNVFFAVIANDDAFEPILAYSDTSFDSDDLNNPGFKWWLETMNESLEQNINQKTKLHRANISIAYKPAVEALIKTKWDQGTPYNNLTPTYTENNQTVHFVTGCAATAMAQTMKYYNYPEKGKGSKSYRCKLYITDKDPITKMITVNFAAGTYSWNDMLEVYAKSGYTQEQADAVSKLMYHCGVSVTMDYDKSGSGTYSFKVIKALVDNFQYSQGLQFYVRDIYSANEWMDIIYRHLSQGHPIIYSGSKSNNGGHAFILDGYDEGGRVHVNWGWSGKSDGYFNISSLNGYSSDQEMIPVFMDESAICHAVFGIYDGSAKFSVLGVNLSASAEYVVNGDYRNFDGSVGLLATSLESGKTTILASNPISVEGFGMNMQLHYTSPSYKNIDISTMHDGLYRIYFATLRNDDLEWQIVRAADGKSNSAILSVSSGVANVTPEKDSNWIVDQTDAIYNPTSNVHPSMFNGCYDLSGRKVQNPGKGLYIINGKKVVR